MLPPPQAQRARGEPEREQAAQRQDRALLVKIPEAARQLGISKSLLYGLLRAGEIQRIRLGPNATRIAVAELEAFVARKRAG
jgi:excisionase family DNA binding protein